MAPSLPPFAAWRHVEARDGFEVVYPEARPDGGVRFTGATTAVEDGLPFAFAYAIDLDAAWRTRGAQLTTRTRDGVTELRLEADGAGRWWADGVERPELEGCLDVDLEASAMTNAFPHLRLGLRPGEAEDAPAAYVRAQDCALERLEQRYERLPAPGRYRYTAPAFSFEAELAYDEHGLVVSYPGLAERVRG